MEEKNPDLIENKDIDNKNININNNTSEDKDKKDDIKKAHRKSKIQEQLDYLNKQSFSNEQEGYDNDDDQFSSVNYDIGKNIYRYNIILVGDCSVGKTSIINRFIENRFNRNLKSTVNIEFRIKSIKLDSNTIVDLKIWDTCGEERFHSITKNFYHEADGIFIVFDLGDFKSFNNIKIFLKDINDICNINNKAIMIIGNKNDLPLEDIKVKEKDIEKILGKNKEFKYLDVSARSGSNIRDMFTQMTKLIFINKNKIIENEDEDKYNNSFENNFQIGNSNSNGKILKNNNNSKEIGEEPKEKCC